MPAPPAPTIITLRPRATAERAYSEVRAGERWAEVISTSNGTRTLMLIAPTGSSYPESIAAIPAPQFAALGARYLEEPAPLRRGQVRPLGLDRYGVRFRVESADGDRDIRLPFHKPVDDMTGLGQAIRVLMGCPFINGLHARR